MLALALDQSDKDDPFFTHGDIHTVRLGKTFDVVISLFHVMSYQAGNQDLLDMFATAAAHLGSSALFIFDCWYGPAVLADRPMVRIKRCSNDAEEVVRIAEPEMAADANLVTVTYQVLVHDKLSGKVEEILEEHRMRYLFFPEIELFANQAGFLLEESFEFMTGKKLGNDTWNGCFVVRKK